MQSEAARKVVHPRAVETPVVTPKSAIGDAPVGSVPPLGVSRAEWSWDQLVYENRYGLPLGSLAKVGA